MERQSTIVSLRAPIIQTEPYVKLPTDWENATWNCLAVQSDIGTGKTKSMIRALQTVPGALYLVPRHRLAENFCLEAAKMGVVVENYKQLSPAERRGPAHIAFCVNSFNQL